MAMNKGLKIAIGIATIGVVGTGLYFLWTKVLRKKINPTKEEEEEKVEEEKKKVQGSSYTPPPNPYPSTPFKSEKEGNKFRKWVNDTYPQYAKDIDLDAEGKYNNRYIRKAYKEYGKEYQDMEKGVGKYAKSTTSSSAKNVVVSGSYANIRSSARVNNGVINNLLGKVSGKGKKIGTLISSGKSLEYGDKKTWYKVQLATRLKGRSVGYVRSDTANLK